MLIKRSFYLPLLLCLLFFLVFDYTSLQAAIPAGFADQLVADVPGPTALAFTPDGRLLITQQTGQLRVYQNGTLLVTPALDLSALICSNVERGLLGVAVDPNFASNNYIYLYYTYDVVGDHACVLADPGPSNPVNRVSRFTLAANNIISPASEKVILSNIQSNWGNHNAGDLKFGSDGYLYISTGDGGHEMTQPRQLINLNGKILRIQVNSSGGYLVSGNPYANAAGVRKCGDPAGFPSGSGPCSEIFASGLRNPFRIAFKPGTSEFYINDVGQGVWEEVDQGIAGADYGWNVREGTCSYPPFSCGNTPSGLTDPIYSYNHSSGCASITGGAFIPAGVWPSPYSGYLFSDYVCGKIFTMTTTPPYSTADFVTGLGVNSAVTLVFGPYNATQALYYTNYNNGGQVRRIYYAGATNLPPTAQISANPVAGAAPLTVNFSGAGSSDPEGSALTYSWTFGDGQSSNNNSAAIIQHLYSANGIYSAQLVVKDTAGNSSPPAPVRIDVGNTAPVPVINAPLDSDRFFVGQQIRLQGSATDAQDGTLPASSLTWEVIQHHIDSRNPQNSHTHPYMPPSNGNNLLLTTPDMEDMYAYDSYLEIRLTATDALGDSTTITRQFLPKKLIATFTTQPSGLAVTVNGVGSLTPRGFYVWQGSALNVTTTNPQTLNGVDYQFSSWSDGGAQSHKITMAANDTTYSALFVAPGTVTPTRTNTPVTATALPATPTPTYTSTPKPATATPTAAATPSNGRALIRIVQNSSPQSAQDFLFYSAFGEFTLDDPTQDDGDAFAKTAEFTTAPGLYNFSVSTNADWRVADIVCSPAQDGVLDLANASVAITGRAGVTVTCTFYAQSLRAPTVTATLKPATVTPVPPTFTTTASATATPKPPTATATLIPTFTATVTRPTATATTVALPTPTSTATTDQSSIWIRLDAQPNTAQDFTFYGPVGSFVLDNAVPDDGDGYSDRYRIPISQQGQFNISQVEPTGWNVQSIDCSPAGVAVVDVANSSVSINAAPGNSITCVFVNVPRAASTPSATVSPVATPTATATSTPVAAACTLVGSTTGLDMPIGVSSVRSSLLVGKAPQIADVNVQIQLTHSYVGDLTITLEQQPSGRRVVLLDRPGVPASNFGCKYDNIAAILSDEALLSVEDRCEAATPTINGSFRPNQLLSTFDGISGNGTWYLDIVDNDPFVDAGALESWSLQLCSNAANVASMALPDNVAQLVEGRSVVEQEDKENTLRSIFLPLISGGGSGQ
ncbi:MAG: PQQ-dependent sugar dehydrogenase [Caldilineaceae bacterium]